MKKIISKQKYVILVDNDDFDRIKKHGWCVEDTGSYKRAFAHIKGKIVRLHRFILNITNPKTIVDHINGNALDNRKSNLRICSRSQNQCNQNVRKQNKSSKYKGVFHLKKNNKWLAYIDVKNKRTTLGRFLTEVDAAKAYNKAAIKYHGEYAKLNNLSKRIRK